jgi:YjbE family integral membrane protein
MLIGTGVAVALRVLLTLVTSAVLQVPLLKLLGGLALVVIAVQLTTNAPGSTDGTGPTALDRSAGTTLKSAVVTVVLADLFLSMDNVVALAAVAGGRWPVLVLGLVLSVPLLMFGSWYLASLLERYPILTPLGGAMLGWIAGGIAVSDPLYAEWMERQSPALSVVVPALVAVYVLLQSRIIDRARAMADALRPPRKAGPSRTPAPEMAVPELASIASSVPPPLLVARIPVAAGDASVPRSRSDSPAAPGDRRRRRSLRLRWLAGGIAGLLLIVAIVQFVSTRMPVPADWTRYECSNEGVVLYYRPGGQRIRITNSAASLDGIVQPSNRIDWGEQGANAALGFVPPSRVLAGNFQAVRVDGGTFEDVTCNAK